MKDEFARENMAKMTRGKGWSLSPDESPQPSPKDNFRSPVPKIRLERRAGDKWVTVISGLHTYGAEKLNGIARELKSACGAGGTVKNGAIEIQGDRLNLIQTWFAKQ
ncbi:MAG TPA: translation initiation factor [bacterium]|nr:translation initiation factor [bacterium]